MAKMAASKPTIIAWACNRIISRQNSFHLRDQQHIVKWPHMDKEDFRFLLSLSYHRILSLNLKHTGSANRVAGVLLTSVLKLKVAVLPLRTIDDR